MCFWSPRAPFHVLLSQHFHTLNGFGANPERHLKWIFLMSLLGVEWRLKVGYAGVVWKTILLLLMFYFVFSHEENVCDFHIFKNIFIYFIKQSKAYCFGQSTLLWSCGCPLQGRVANYKLTKEQTKRRVGLYEKHYGSEHWFWHTSDGHVWIWKDLNGCGVCCLSFRAFPMLFHPWSLNDVQRMGCSHPQSLSCPLI